MMGNIKRVVSTIFGATFEHYFGFGALFKHLLGIFGSTFLAFWEHNLERPSSVDPSVDNEAGKDRDWVRDYQWGCAKYNTQVPDVMSYAFHVETMVSVLYCVRHEVCDFTQVLL